MSPLGFHICSDILQICKRQGLLFPLAASSVPFHQSASCSIVQVLYMYSLHGGTLSVNLLVQISLISQILTVKFPPL